MRWFPKLAHNLKISLRILSRTKGYTSINLAGLVLGLTVSFILLIFAVNELSYNRCFKNSGRIYRVINTYKSGEKGGFGPFILKPSLSGSFSEIETSARIIHLNFMMGTVSVKSGDVSQEVPDFLCADPELTGMLGMNFYRGSTKHLLEDPGQVILSDRAARKMFRFGNPIGKTLHVSINGVVYPLVVSAVYAGLPWNSTIQADFITGIGFYKEVLRQVYPDPEEELNKPGDYTAQTFIMLKKEARIDRIKARIPAFLSRTNLDPGSVSFQNMRDIYLHSENIQNDFIARGSSRNLYIYLSLSFFILLLASINYSMLSTARAALRFKEIGVRKVLGASRGNLIGQILSESVLLTLFAFPLSYLLIGLIDPVLEEYYGYQLHLNAGNLLLYLSVSSAVSVVIGLLSGVYVALYLSALNPVTALRSNFIIYKKVSLSKIFIVTQIFITLVLFIGLINVYLQIRFCLTRDQGIERQHLLVVSFNQDDNRSYRMFKNDIEKLDYVSSCTGSSIQIPTASAKTVNIGVPSLNNKKIKFESISVDYNFFTTLGARMVSGHDFGHQDSLKDNPVIINEEAARVINYNGASHNIIYTLTTVGVAGNFNIHTLHKKIGPTLYALRPSECNTMIIRYKAGNEHQLQALISRKMKSGSPEAPIAYNFFDSELKAMYVGEENFARIVASFSLLAFIITGMGLFGLAMLIVERRLKEMSVRKVFGASSFSIIYLIQKEFILYILIAAVFAIPLAWYLLPFWLDRFYYHIDIHWYIFLLSVIFVGIFVSLILFLKTLRVLRENPANALKYE